MRLRLAGEVVADNAAAGRAGRSLREWGRDSPGAAGWTGRASRAARHPAVLIERPGLVLDRWRMDVPAVEREERRVDLPSRTTGESDEDEKPRKDRAVLPHARAIGTAGPSPKSVEPCRVQRGCQNDRRLMGWTSEIRVPTGSPEACDNCNEWDLTPAGVACDNCHKERMLQGTVPVLKVLLAGLDGVTEQEVARKTGINRASLSMIKTGERKATSDQALALGAFFQVNPKVFGVRVPGATVRQWVSSLVEDAAPTPTTSHPATGRLVLRLLERYDLKPSEVREAAASGKRRAPPAITNVVIPTDEELAAVCRITGQKPSDVKKVGNFELLCRLLGRPPGGAW